MDGERMDRKVVVFGTSLNPESKSQVLAREVVRRLGDEDGVSWELVDLRRLRLPATGKAGALGGEEARGLRRLVADATHVVFAVPIYNFNVSSGAKNLLELLTADEMKDKIVGLVCVAGGKNSYMSLLPFANSLMLDFRAWIVPRYVYAVGSEFDGQTLASSEIHSRLDLFVRDLLDGPAGFSRCREPDAAGPPRLAAVG